MTARSQEIAAALERVEAVLIRKPSLGLHDDAAATARWEGGTRVVAGHANGTRVPTDMPSELGGSGDQVSPGWLFRAGIASCAATRIAMAAATAGIQLTELETSVHSRSDTRGLLGMSDERGQLVSAGPQDVELRVKVAASGVSAAYLRELVEQSQRFSPIPVAVQCGVQIALHVEAEGD